MLTKLSQIYSLKKELFTSIFFFNLFLFLQIVNSNAENVGADKTISSLNTNQQVVTADDVHITITNNGSVERTGQKAIKNTDSEHKKNVGYLSENNPLYMDFYIQEYLTFIGNLNGLFKDDLEKRKKLVIELCGLNSFQNEKISNLSKGYRKW